MGKTKAQIKFEAKSLIGETIKSESVMQKGVQLWLINSNTQRWVPCKYGTLKLVNHE